MKKEKQNKSDQKTVKAINKNIRSSVRKLSPILKSIFSKATQNKYSNCSTDILFWLLLM